MSRLLKAFAEAERQLSRGGGSGAAAALGLRFQRFVQDGASAADCAAAATLLAKRPRAAEEALAGVADIDARGLLKHLGAVALPRLAAGAFGPEETTELLHALSRAPDAQLRRGLQASSGAVQRAVTSLEPQALALVANSYARAKLRDQPLMLQIARRGSEVLCRADASATAGLAHAFANLQTYHHGLFSAIKRRLSEVLHELSIAEVAACLYAIARSLPPSHRGDPVEAAFDIESPRGFGSATLPLLERLRQEIEKNNVDRETALLAVQAMDIMQFRDDSTASRLLSDAVLGWRSASPTEICTALHAVSNLEVRSVPVSQMLRLPALGRASPQQLCMLSSSLNRIIHAPFLPARARLRCRRSYRAWLRLLSDACQAAVVQSPARDEDGQASPLRSASPAAALGCLVLLPSSTWPCALGAAATLPDLRRFLQFSRHLRSAQHASESAGGLTTSELQTMVELTLRRIALVEKAEVSFRAEVFAAPFWLDLVVPAEFAAVAAEPMLE